MSTSVILLDIKKRINHLEERIIVGSDADIPLMDTLRNELQNLKSYAKQLEEELYNGGAQLLQE